MTVIMLRTFFSLQGTTKPNNDSFSGKRADLMPNAWDFCSVCLERIVLSTKPPII